GLRNNQRNLRARTLHTTHYGSFWTTLGIERRNRPDHFGVKSGHRALQSPCPLYTRKRTCALQLGMSAMGQKRTHALHQWSINWSARSSTVGGIVRPSSLAVFRLMISSNLVGCSTGISPGFAPLKIILT